MTPDELSTGSGMRRKLGHMDYVKVTDLTAQSSPEGIGRSARVFGVDHAARARRLQSAAAPFKSYRAYPFAAARTSARASSVKEKKSSKKEKKSSMKGKKSSKNSSK